MNWYYNLKIRTKILLSFSAVLLITAYIGLIGFSKLEDLDDSDTILYQNMTVPLSEVMTIATAYQGVNLDLRDIILADTPDEIYGEEKAITKNRDLITSTSELFEKTILSDEVKDAYNEFLRTRKEFLPVLQEIITLAKLNNDEQAFVVLNTRGMVVAENEMNAINKLVEIKLRHAKEKSDSNTILANNAQLTIIILLVIGLIISFVIGLVLEKYISKNISVIVERFNSLENLCLTNLSAGGEKLAAGDLDIKIITGTKSIDVKTKDEIGKLSESVNNIILKIQGTSKSIEGASGVVKDMVEETKLLVNSALNGNLSVRSNTSRFKGGFKEVLDGLNKTLDTVIEPIQESGQVLQHLSKGDLTVKMKGNYKGDLLIIKDSINNLSQSMNNAISDVASAVQATASAATEISSSTEQMAAGAQEQTQQASEVASAIEQMAKTIFDSTENISQASEITRSTSAIAEKGAKKIEDTKRGMDKIVVAAENTGNIITSLAGKTDEIGEITQVIDDIADQTNLLALNAAIEAARAGEQGRGFAVVADEVRKLAERTTKATKEIAETIKLIQSEAKGADQAMHDAKVAVEEGKKLTEEVAIVLSEMLQGAKKVNDVITYISAASEEQSTASEQISKNIEGISSVTQESAAGTHQIARAAEDLNRLTENLQNLVARFTIKNVNTTEFEESYSSLN